MIFKNKRGAEIALNAIIIAVILLVVAFVVIFIFVSKTGKTSEATDSCGFRGGKCVDTESACNGPTIRSLNDCTENAPLCCIEIGKIAG